MGPKAYMCELGTAATMVPQIKWVMKTFRIYRWYFYFCVYIHDRDDMNIRAPSRNSICTEQLQLEGWSDHTDLPAKGIVIQSETLDLT